MENGTLQRVHDSARTSSRIARALLVGLLLLAALVFVAPPSNALASEIIDIAAVPGGSGYWQLHENGNVSSHGGAPFHGNGKSRAAAFAVTPDGGGYWIIGANGGVEAFGNAADVGGFDHLQLASGVVDAATTPSGAGIWIVAGDGGIFTTGDAQFFGSTGGMQLAGPVVGIAPTASGNGYWLVAEDGGIFTFGDAAYLGSMGGTTLDQDVIAIVTASHGVGYMMIAADGGVFTFGANDFHGSLGGQGRTDVVGIAPILDGTGYFMTTITGAVFGFGSAVAPPPPTPAQGKETVENTIGREIFDRINTDRALRGQPPYRWDTELADVAKSWSATMSSTGFRHSNLDVVIGNLSTIHYVLGENIYWGTGPHGNSAVAHQTLMDSSGHRTAILETAYTTLGIGIVCTGGRVWVTELFGHPSIDGPVNSQGWQPRSPQVDFSATPSTGC